MKNIKFMYSKIILLSGLLFVINVGCEREISDEAEFATFSKTGEIFTDAPIGLGTDFYFPFEGSKPTAWTVDESEGYESDASMRFDVPNANDPEGNYAGAIFRVDGSGRNLTEFDALTFWAKASQGVSIGQMGFGTDFGEDKYQVSAPNISLSTNWVKYVIPIPDPSKLFEERGVFWYSTGTLTTGGLGYTFWIDELKYEKLGTIAQPQPAIFNGEENVPEKNFNGSTIDLADRGLTQTFNLASGLNLTVNVAPSYFTFKSSNPRVASVREFGLVDLISEGNATITATLDGVLAKGSMEITSTRGIQSAPIPTRAANNVISIFSDQYTDVPIDFFNAGWEGSTTQTTTIGSDEDAFMSYTQNNYVGIGFENPTIDASAMEYLHLDIYTDDVISGNFEIQIRDRGANGTIDSDFNGFPTEDDKDVRFLITNLPSGEWTQVDIPLTGNLASQKNNLALIVFVGGVPNFVLDNIYFYNEN